MADVRGFLKHGRESTTYRPVDERLQDWKCVQEDFPLEKTQTQAARCMDCGIPFCNQGCPLGNIIPDFNDLVFRDKWEDALARLHSTNNFPEFTGMVCPAPCEQACVLGVNQDPVTIKQVEWEIIRRGWEEGWVRPVQPERRSGRSVAVVGSGPAGLACAQQLTRAGHTVTLFEKNDRVGGLLRYGIPDFKLEKHVIDRRLEQMREEGVLFQTGVHAGVDLRVAEILQAGHVEGSDKLLQFKVDLGGETRNIFSGIKSAYDPEQLVGRLTIVVANLAPRKMRFGTSEGMILCAGSGEDEIYLLQPDSGAKPGMRIT